MADICESYIISENHPSLKGHFPNNPIVPAVVILDYVRNLLESSLTDQRIKTLANSKFIRPLFPQQEFTINLNTIAAHKIKFECISNGEKIIYGTFITEERL
ncbi:MAG: hypothetical protein GQ569_04460 [Methylococcaceae bacterium]|nr:hypothetical protein [Methylococcaceae bacterium]